MDDKIKFIEEAKVRYELKEELREELEKSPRTLLHSNPIRANLMKFVNFKQKKKFTIKDLF